jgi:hypothetical protein
MASILKVDTIQDQSGNNIINENADTITIGASGDTVTIPTGASLTVPSGGLTGQNYPAFSVKLTSSQTVTNNTNTKIQFNSEIIDTDSAFDSTTNYRFTVPSGKAGKYFITGGATGFATNTGNLNYFRVHIYKNGTLTTSSEQNSTSGSGFDYVSANTSIILDLAENDYLELYGLVRYFSAATVVIVGDNYLNGLTNFSGYRIGA